MNVEEIRKMFPEYDDLPDNTLADGLHGKFFSDMAKDIFLSTLGVAAQGPEMLGLREGEWNAKDKSTTNAPRWAELNDIPIPNMHQGKMLNLSSRAHSDGSAQSLDLYLQPSISPKGIGLNGGGLLFRKTW